MALILLSQSGEDGKEDRAEASERRSVAAAECATGACVALFLAWDALRDERAWYASLGVHRR